MSHHRTLGYLLLGTILGLGLFLDAPAQQPGGKDKPPPKPAVHEVIQEFPTNDVMKTAWKVHWSQQTGYGLYIMDAWFKKAPAEPWIQVVGDVRLAEMFVPYNTGSPRFWDISYNFSLINLTRDEAGPYGKLLGNPPVVMQEVRDRGIMWLDSGNKPTRRGQKLVLWAALNAANYRYIMEFGFHDDGTIACRCGSTGRNYGSREFEGHMHNALWRVDVNLAGPDHNTVQVMEHFEPDGEEKAKAKTVHRPFNGGREGYEDWDAEKFTMLSVINEKKKNVRKQPWTYDVVTQRMGNGRHFGGDKEECTLHDFWVTRNRPGEIFYVNLPKYVAKSEPINNTDIVLWLSTAGHHDPRSEDGEMTKDNNFVGATPVMWTGFDLRPRNLWDSSPLYP